MITFENAVLVPPQGGANSKYREEGSCLSTDTKPTDVANGSILKEMDTGTLYFFDEEGTQWLPFE